nr:MAG TPA: hypothetical protein [Caudoviricetes sp.]
MLKHIPFCYSIFNVGLIMGLLIEMSKVSIDRLSLLFIFFGCYCCALMIAF